MKEFFKKNIIATVGSLIAIVLVVCAIFSSKQKIFVNQNAQAVKPASIIKTANGNFELNSNEVIVKASQLLGKNYAFGYKGTNGVNLWTNKAQASNIQSANDISGIDCSGLVYWTLSSLAKDKGWSFENGTVMGSSAVTSGFSRNNPVPLDTMDWLSYWNGRTSIAWKETGNQYATSVDNVNLTIHGKSINVLKKNDKITSSLRYYQYIDDNGNKKVLPAGTVIISYGTGIGAAYDHAWITLGDLNTTDPSKVKEILKEMGVSESLLNNNIVKTHESCTYWRIESVGNRGVYINNGDPDEGSISYDKNVSKKAIGPIWAFQVANEVKIEGKYNIEILKVDENGRTINKSAKFSATVNGASIWNSAQSTNSGKLSVSSQRKIENVNGVDKYEFTEEKTPDGYISKDAKTSVNVYFKVNGNKYVVDKDKTRVANGNANLSFSESNGVVTVTVKIKNVEIKPGKYYLNLYKIVEEAYKSYANINLDGNNPFEVRLNGQLLTNYDINSTQIHYAAIDINNLNDDRIVIKEVNSPVGFNKVDTIIDLSVKKVERYGRYGIKEIRGKVGTKDIVVKPYQPYAESNGLYIDIVNTDEITYIPMYIPNTPKVDLALRKVITEVNGKQVRESNGFNANEERHTVWEVDSSRLGLGDETAKYYANKTPVTVNPGDVVTYELRVYNEGGVSAKAREIRDYLPNGLDIDSLEVYYKAAGTSFVEKLDLVEQKDVTGKNYFMTVVGEYGDQVIIKLDNPNSNLIPAYDVLNDKLSYATIIIKVKVHSNASGILTNIAEISEYQTAKEIIKTDRDSTSYNLDENVDVKHSNKDNDDWVNYKNNEITSTKEYIPGNEDDDDFEKIRVVPVDLALKKVITEITRIGDWRLLEVSKENGFNVDRHNGYNVDASSLENTTNATYTLNKTPVEVAKGDRVYFAIRVFNEGGVNAKASQINDYIPVGLNVQAVFYKNEEIRLFDIESEHIDENSLNNMIEELETKIYAVYYRTNGVLKIFLKDADVIDAYDSTREISYDEVKVKCIVDGTAEKVLTNVAEIAEYSTEFAVIKSDIDSTSDNWNSTTGYKIDTDKSSDEWRDYANGLQNLLDGGWHPIVSQDVGVNGHKGDDDDFEKLILKKYYNLSIKKINASEGNSKVNDIKFNITRKKADLQAEVFEDLETQNGEIFFNTELGNYGAYNIKYTLQEVENNNYVQLANPINLELIVNNGIITGYKFAYGNKTYGDIHTTSEIFECRSVEGIALNVKVNFLENDITIEISNKVILPSQYNIRLRKISSGNSTSLQGVTFAGEFRSYELGERDSVTASDLGLSSTDANGYTNVITKNIYRDNYTKIDEYLITETNLGANTGYKKMNSNVKVLVYKTINENEEFVVEKYVVEVAGKSFEIGKNNTNGNVVVEESGVKFVVSAEQTIVDGIPTINLTVTNAPDNTIPLQIRKVLDDNDSTSISNTEYTVYREGIQEPLFTGVDLTGILNLTDNVEAGINTVVYRIVEENAAEGYDNIFSNKYIKLTVTLEDGVPTAVTAKVFNRDNSEYTKGPADEKDLNTEISANIIDVDSVKTIDLKIENPETAKIIDLALKKIITEINGVKVNAENGMIAKYDRLTEGNNKFSINTQPLKNGEYDAEYYLNKTPILVKKGDTIKYEIRIYNEGEEDATASKITDYIPEGLEFVKAYYRNGNTPLVEGDDYNYNSDTNVLVIKVLKDKELIAKFEGQDNLAFDYVTVECKVKNTAEGLLTNVAEISEYKIETGVVDSDRDSEPANWKNPVDENIDNNGTVNTNSNKWRDYQGKKGNSVTEGVFGNYKGQQDDDDFEKIEIGEIDLVLKKIITHVNSTSVDSLSSLYHRFQAGKINVNTTFMNQNSDVTTAEYYLNKTPIRVKLDDMVTYQIRIYNEGSFDATASEITDYIPKGLDFVSAKYNGTALVENTDYSIQNNVLKITAMKGNLIEKYKGDKWNNVEPSYDYVEVTCKVNGQVKGLLTNVAEISEYEISYGTVTTDRDSQTVGNGEWKCIPGANKLTVDGKSGTSWARYYNSISSGRFMDYAGQQDDDDFEKILVTNGYNLQLQKISALDNSKGLAGVSFNINSQQYTTNSEGYIEKLGVFEIDLPENLISELDHYSIDEVRNSDGKYVKLKNPIYLFVRKDRENDGSVKLKGYFINTKENRPMIDAVYNDLTYGTSTYHAYDENNNLVDIIITVSEDTVNIENYNIDIKLENNISNNVYDLYINKVDKSGTAIDNVKFNFIAATYERTINGQCVTSNGTAYIGRFKIDERNLNFQDMFTIREIEAPNKYFVLSDDLKLAVNKRVNSDKTDYELASIKLISDNTETEEGTNVVLRNVKLKDTNKTVDITAKLEGNRVTITVENIEKEFDLSLRKFITSVNGTALENDDSREPIVDSSKLASGEATTAKYNHSKDPAQVHVKDIVEYTIRVYNEGERDGFAELVMDDIPDGVEMIAPGDSSENTSIINQTYRWKMYRKLANGETAVANEVITYAGYSYVLTDDAKEAEIIVTDYLSSARGDDLIIRAFNPDVMSTPDYKDLKVEFKVKPTAEPGNIIVNKAQITEDLDENKEPVNDRDSTPNVWEDSPRDDDQDIEKIIVVKEKEFDLSLRKFISSVNGNKLEGDESREPKVDSSKLASGEATTAEYNHTKVAKLVSPKDIVEYTLRVYNEGEIDGYATRVMDDIPDGVEMVAPTYDENGKPTNLNAEYRWVMYKKDGNNYVETTDVKEAEVIVTDYLSKENGTQNLLKAFDYKLGVFTKDNYRDIKVEFKVKPTNEENKIITNYAQITENTNSEGNPVIDRDSTPNKWEDSPRDDDQDIERIKVRYFDLALYKWVSSAIVIEDGKVTEHPSNHTQDDKSKLVNVTIPKDKLNKVTVKFKYQIKVENQGQLEGYAKEIKDHVPAGLKFVAEDNIDYGWVLEKDGTITTDYLKGKLLKPGETAEVTVVLTWVNGENNLNRKVNFAEISKDYNDYDAPDKDSTPDNFTGKSVEDDEDDDVVMLQVRTGMQNFAIYSILGISVMAIIAIGVAGIKKFVI